MRALKDGEKRAYEKLFAKFWSKTVKYLSYMMQDCSAAEDAAQNVFLKIWNTRDRLDSVKSLDSYVFSIAHNEACDYLRKNRPVRLDESFAETIIYDRHLGLDESKIKNIVEKCVSSLPDQRRICFKMSREEQLSNKEIANRLNLSQRTVEHHISFALKAIRESLDKNLS